MVLDTPSTDLIQSRPLRLISGQVSASSAGGSGVVSCCLLSSHASDLNTHTRARARSQETGQDNSCITLHRKVDLN